MEGNKKIVYKCLKRMKTNHKYSNDTSLAVSIAVGHHFVSILLFMDIIMYIYHRIWDNHIAGGNTQESVRIILSCNQTWNFV